MQTKRRTMIFIFYALQFSIETNHTDDLQPDRFPCHDYFFALKNVTFCGFHPTEQHYLGFITKHPNEERFACHVFQGNGSTRHVAEAIGYSNVKFYILDYYKNDPYIVYRRAFQRFCRKFVELAYPIHEFYME